MRGRHSGGPLLGSLLGREGGGRPGLGSGDRAVELLEPSDLVISSVASQSARPRVRTEAAIIGTSLAIKG
jgi:hypothetical protein